MVEAGLEEEAACEEHLQEVIGLVTAEQHCLPETGKVRPAFGLIGTGWIQEATCFLPVCNIGGEDTAIKIDTFLLKKRRIFDNFEKIQKIHKMSYMMYLKPTNC